jgi:hypothetical protein
MKYHFENERKVKRMAIDFEKFNKEFGGEKAMKELAEAKENEITEIPSGNYVCKIDKLQLDETKDNRPKVFIQFRIIEGVHKNQCIFFNGVMAAANPEYNGFVRHKTLEFLRDLEIFDDSEVDFDGDYRHFNDLLLDMAEESEGMKFEIKTYKDKKDYTQFEVIDVFE